MTGRTRFSRRFDGGKLFQTVFITAAFIAASVTFFSISNVNPTRPFTGFMPWVFGVNAVLIAGLGVLLVRRYQLLQANGTIRGRGQLVRRFLLLFSLSSVVPATIVAIFLGATVTQGLDNWFETRIGSIVEDAADLANENVDAVVAAIDTQAREAEIRMNFSDTALAATRDPERYASYLGRQAIALGFRAAYLVAPNGDLLITADVPRPLSFRPISEDAINEANQGVVGQVLYEQTGFVTATVLLDNPENAYLHLVAEVDTGVFTRLRQAEASVLDYRQAETASGQLQTFFAIGYAQIVALALLLFARLGLEAGSQIAGPLGRLATAAELVRDGDLTARVALPGNDDEIDTLAESFNTMTAQLGEQRAALMSARSTSEDRRQFLETLLSQISAGVIRTDRAMTITLANKSAESLVGRGSLQGQALGDVLPEFLSHAHAVIRDGGTGDTSLEINMDGEARHIRLRTLADSDEGCVLTFDDATRIVTAQRHMAWRDVARRIAHEIRNPLTPIHLAAERLNRRYASKIDADDDVFARSLDTITRQASDIGRMVNEFSNFARMPKPELRPFDLPAMIGDIMFSQRVVSPDIRFEFDQGTEPLTYFGDERLLAQAFTNLVKNAAEAILAMPEELEVTGLITLKVKRTGDLLDIMIEDNGPGFPEEQRDRLLEPYVTTRDRGTGLGLAIVNRVIIDHGGAIMLQSRPDRARGACVRITLPIEQTSMDSTGRPEASKENA